MWKNRSGEWETALEWPTPGRSRQRHQKTIAAQPWASEPHLPPRCTLLRRPTALSPRLKPVSWWLTEGPDRQVQASSSGPWAEEQDSGKCAYTSRLLSESPSGVSTTSNKGCWEGKASPPAVHYHRRIAWHGLDGGWILPLSKRDYF